MLQKSPFFHTEGHVPESIRRVVESRISGRGVSELRDHYAADILLCSRKRRPDVTLCRPAGVGCLPGGGTCDRIKMRKEVLRWKQWPAMIRRWGSCWWPARAARLRAFNGLRRGPVPTSPRPCQMRQRSRHAPGWTVEGGPLNCRWTLAGRIFNGPCAIPYGATRSYGEIAAALGRPTASRAVGAAVGRNPIWLAIPCHRVVGRGGALTGYAGGLERKARLLELERNEKSR